MLTTTTMQETIEELTAMINDELGTTNSQLSEFSVSIRNHDVVVVGRKPVVTLLVYSETDTQRLDPILRFKQVLFPSMKFLQVVLAIWKYCNEE